MVQEQRIFIFLYNLKKKKWIIRVSQSIFQVPSKKNNPIDMVFRRRTRVSIKNFIKKG
jgi:hypothetical protein